MYQEKLIWIIVSIAVITLIFMNKTKEYRTVGDYEFEDVTSGAVVVDSVLPEMLQGLTDSVVYSYLVKLQVRFPEIVVAQCKLESGNYTSEIFKWNNNLTGMRLPSVRATVAVGESKGYAVYESWQMCLVDYAMWQLYNVPRYFTENEYYKMLAETYSGNGNDYVKEVRKIRNQVFNFKF